MPPARRRRRLDSAADAARTAAEDELRALRAALTEAEEEVDRRREALADAITRHMSADTLRPTEASDASGYDRVYVSRLARERGAPPQRSVEPPQSRSDS